MWALTELMLGRTNYDISAWGYVRLYRGATTAFGSPSQVGGNMVGGLGAEQSLSDPAGVGAWNYWVRGFTSAGVAGVLTGPVAVTVT